MLHAIVCEWLLKCLADPVQEGHICRDEDGFFFVLQIFRQSLRTPLQRPSPSKPSNVKGIVAVYSRWAAHFSSASLPRSIGPQPPEVVMRNLQGALRSSFDSFLSVFSPSLLTRMHSISERHQREAELDQQELITRIVQFFTELYDFALFSPFLGLSTCEIVMHYLAKNYTLCFPPGRTQREQPSCWRQLHGARFYEQYLKLLTGS